MASGPFPAVARGTGGRAAQAGDWLRAAAAANLVPVVAAGLIVALIVALLAFIVYMTFVPSLPTEPGFTLAHWALLLSPRFLTTVLPNTVAVGLGTIAIAAFFAL